MSGGLQLNCVITSRQDIKIHFLTFQMDCNGIILLRVDMALQFISLHVMWITTKLYFASSHGPTLYFLTCEVDCNEIELLRVDVALHFISLHIR